MVTFDMKSSLGTPTADDVGLMREAKEAYWLESLLLVFHVQDCEGIRAGEEQF